MILVIIDPRCYQDQGATIDYKQGYPPRLEQRLYTRPDTTSCRLSCTDGLYFSGKCIAMRQSSR